jgi:hypothetical protein
MGPRYSQGSVVRCRSRAVEANSLSCLDRIPRKCTKENIDRRTCPHGHLAMQLCTIALRHMSLGRLLEVQNARKVSSNDSTESMPPSARRKAYRRQRNPILDYHAPNLGGRQTETGHGYHAHDITQRECAAASAEINQDRSGGAS